MAQAANLLIQGLSKAGVQTAMKEFGKSMKSMEKTTKLGGFTEFNQSLELIGKLQSNVLTVPTSVLLGQLQAGTTKASVTLMGEMLELLNSDSVQTSIKAFSGFLSGVLEGAAVILDGLEKSINDTTGASKNLEDVMSGTAIIIDGVILSMEEYNQLLAEQAEAAKAAAEEFERLADKFGDMRVGFDRTLGGAQTDFG